MQEGELKLVLITGASSGVGAAAAQVFAERGDRVVLVARSKDALTTLAHEIGEGAFAAPCDVAEPDQVARLAKQITSEFGTPDIILNCAGAGMWKTVPETTPQEAVSMMNAPYFAAFNTTHAFLTAMLQRGSGTIIHVNSPACIAAWPSSAGYTATRAALKGFHEALSQDLIGTGVRSVHVIFGKIASEYFDHNPGVVEKMPALARTVRTLPPMECARLLEKLSRAPRHSIIHPMMLKLHCLTAILLPGFARWLLRF